MSVEERKRAILDCVREVEGRYGKQLTSMFWEEALDLLIREVRAGMPCYEWDDCQQRERFADQPDTLEYYTDVCPPCTARAELAARKVTA